MARLAHLKRQKFLEAFRRCGNVSAACAAAGVPRRTAYNWRQSSSFAEAWQDAATEAAERLEQALWDVAMPHPAERATTELLRDRSGRPLKHPVTGEDWYEVTHIVRWTEYDTNAIICLLKARRPDRYRERMDVRHSSEVTITDPLDALNAALERLTAYEGEQVTPLLGLHQRAQLALPAPTFDHAQQERYLR